MSLEGKAILLLTRKIGETINIGDSVTVTVTEVRGNQVQLGIEAPKHIDVHRSEIYDKIQLEKAQEKKAS